MRELVSITCDADGGVAGGGDVGVGVAGVGMKARCLLGTLKRWATGLVLVSDIERKGVTRLFTHRSSN